MKSDNPSKKEAQTTTSTEQNADIIPYDKKDLESMDNLLEKIEE